MTQYPAKIENADGSVRLTGEVEFTDTTNQPVLGVSGAALITAVAAPADGAIQANQCFLWFTATDGAAKLGIKGKSANGTVVAALVALS